MAHSHAAPAAAGRAAGASSSDGIPDPDEVQALLVDIFALTGQKVQKDDPLVAAALIHSALLRRAGEDAAQAIKQAAAKNATQPLDDGAGGALHWLGLWHSQVVLGAALFVICFLASALGSLLAASACR